MKGIETKPIDVFPGSKTDGSDHCPAMKGIETSIR